MKTTSNPKILLYDIETTPITVYSWNLYPDSLSHKNLVQDWAIICASYKYLGDKEVKSLQHNKPYDDYKLVKQLREVLINADVIVGHNSKKFDTKRFNARLIYHGLEPLPKLTQVDTLQEIKKVATFTSHRLDYLDQIFSGKGKIHTEYNLWIDVIKGSKQALKKMVEYCNEDVNCLERLYLKLRPYMQTHPHIGVLSNGEKCDCPKCGSINTIVSKTRVTATGNKQQQRQCKDCGSYHTVPLKQIK